MLFGLLAIGVHGASATAAKVPDGGLVRVLLHGPDVGSLDPALAYDASWYLVDTTCARLLTSASGSHGSSGLVPEVAVGYPRSAPDGKTLTFTLRSGFRFSDGKTVRADAFARAIHRILARPRCALGAVLPRRRRRDAGREREEALATGVSRKETRSSSGSHDRLPTSGFGRTCSARCRRRCRSTEGIGAYPAAGPYYVAEYRPAERIVIRRNRFYGGKRPHHVDGFDVDLRAGSLDEVLDRIERGDADWGLALTPAYLDPNRRLVAKYGLNRSQFFVTPGPASAATPSTCPARCSGTIRGCGRR